MQVVLQIHTGEKILYGRHYLLRSAGRFLEWLVVLHSYWRKTLDMMRNFTFILEKNLRCL